MLLLRIFDRDFFAGLVGYLRSFSREMCREEFVLKVSGAGNSIIPKISRVCSLCERSNLFESLFVGDCIFTASANSNTGYLNLSAPAPDIYENIRRKWQSGTPELRATVGLV